MVCDRCRAIRGAFGSREPLPPKIASLDAEPRVPASTGPTQEFQGYLQPEDNNNTNPSGFSDPAPHPKNETENASESTGTAHDSVVAVQQHRPSHTPSTRTTLASTPLQPTSASRIIPYTSAECSDTVALRFEGVQLDPLASRIASLHVEPKTSTATKLTEPKLQTEDNSDTNLSNFSDSILRHLKDTSKSPDMHDSVVAVQQDPPSHTPSAPTGSASSAATSPPAPTPSEIIPYTSAKCSDTVALGSEGVQPETTANDGTDKIPRTILDSIMRDPDILHVLMSNCPDFSTLLALVTSCKAAQCAFEQYPQGIIKAMLSAMSQELRYLTVALIGINGSYAGSFRSIETLMETWLGRRAKRGRGAKPGRTPKLLEERLQVSILETNTSLCRALALRISPRHSRYLFTYLSC